MQTQLSEQSNYEPQLTLEIDCSVRSNLMDFVNNRCRRAVRPWPTRSPTQSESQCIKSSLLYILMAVRSQHLQLNVLNSFCSGCHSSLCKSFDE
jgi:hypothetical protein